MKWIKIDSKTSKRCTFDIFPKAQKSKVSSLKIGCSNRVISVISVVLRESTLTISVSAGEPVSMESETVSGFPEYNGIIRDNN